MSGQVGTHPLPQQKFFIWDGQQAGSSVPATHRSGHYRQGHPHFWILSESALEAGLSAAGVDIALTGPPFYPGIAYLTRQVGACGGIVISASHNPYHDNGIKFFSESGKKLDDETEESIEALMSEPMSTVGPEALWESRAPD